MEVYFSKPNWRFLSGTQNNQHQVPVRFDWYSPRGHREINVFNFDAEAAALTQFDIKPCFTFEQQRLVHFSLAGKDLKFGSFVVEDKYACLFAFRCIHTCLLQYWGLMRIVECHVLFTSSVRLLKTVIACKQAVYFISLCKIHVLINTPAP